MLHDFLFHREQIFNHTAPCAVKRAGMLADTVAPLKGCHPAVIDDSSAIQELESAIRACG
jgi:hypothetical protein